MKYKYLHDEALSAVYCFPEQPTIRDKRDKHNNIITWTVSMEVEITRADNILVETNTWKYRTSDYPTQMFENIGNRYTHDIVISLFYRNHAPKGKEINEDTYIKLKDEYAKMARKNRK